MGFQGGAIREPFATGVALHISLHIIIGYSLLFINIKEKGTV
jgi:hypothetical protein